ncbi:UDP-3-O-(3-hydroxymyristoyl)glucosamine N-acyltransferase [Saccharospirillum impatiens]|uniref:UDP-3-O-(3-hydroxymyristoyl)glucosamine N-acyltransferase n=1 Tax=Saccharospirillum impatiens TaxID=169438 RepID=UPI000412CEC6|nr:UDP-3-O-(3-hydroxymyristoyl)glucosamine N-acyltransferase [Saccharospirillum impatiens]
MITARQLAEQLDAELGGNEQFWDEPLERVSALDQATSGSLTFLASRQFLAGLSGSQATVIVLRPDVADQAPATAALIMVPDPYLAYARISHRFSREPKPNGLVHVSATVAGDAVVAEGVSIGPGAVIGSGVHIGAGSDIGAGAVLEAGVRVGSNTRIMANVTLCHGVVMGDDCRVQSGTVIGSDGFGFAPDGERWQRIAQVGTVRIGDRVDIGANVSIDRGAISDTRIEDDVIIDNLVQIAHNVVIGRSTALAGQVGIAGSTTLGAGCTVGGQAGFAGHITVASGSHFTGQAMVTKTLTDPGVYSSGWPAQPSREWRRTVARLRQLEQYEQRLKSLEKALATRPAAPESEDSE